MKTLSSKDVKAMLTGIIDDLKNEKNQDIIKDVLATFIESIVFDAANSTASLTYHVGNTRGVKLASPRRCEPHPCFRVSRSLNVSHRNQRLQTFQR